MNTVLKKSFNDQVFEGRNKNFGAYFLRRIYEKNILKSCIIAGSAFTIALLSPVIYNSYFQEEEKEISMQMVEVTLEEIPSIAPKEELPPPPPAAAIEPPKVSKVKFLPPVVTPDEKVKVEEVPTSDDLKDKNPGDENVKGETLNEIPDTEVKAQSMVEESKPVDDKIYTWVEETAEFPGGIEELKKFLVTNLKYPKEALDKQVSGFVGIRFVINKDGSITDVVVEKSAGYGMDEEALRVIKNMPRWKPARQNGSPARLEKKIKIPFVLK